MKNREFVEYLRVTGELKETDATIDYYLGYISNKRFEIKDIYMKLKDDRVGNFFLLKLCTVLCILFEKQAVDKELLLKILVDAEKFRLDNFSKDAETFSFCLEDMITSIMNSKSLVEMEVKLRKIQDIQNWKSVVIDNETYYADYYGHSVNKVSALLRLDNEVASSHYIVLSDTFILIKNNMVACTGIYGIGFDKGKPVLIQEPYRDYGAFDYIIY